MTAISEPAHLAESKVGKFLNTKHYHFVTFSKSVLIIRNLSVPDEEEKRRDLYDYFGGDRELGQDLTIVHLGTFPHKEARRDGLLVSTVVTIRGALWARLFRVVITTSAELRIWAIREKPICQNDSHIISYTVCDHKGAHYADIFSSVPVVREPGHITALHNEKNALPEFHYNTASDMCNFPEKFYWVSPTVLATHEKLLLITGGHGSEWINQITFFRLRDNTKASRHGNQIAPRSVLASCRMRGSENSDILRIIPGPIPSTATVISRIRRDSARGTRGMVIVETLNFASQGVRVINRQTVVGCEFRHAFRDKENKTKYIYLLCDVGYIVYDGSRFNMKEYKYPVHGLIHLGQSFFAFMKTESLRGIFQLHVNHDNTVSFHHMGLDMKHKRRNRSKSRRDELVFYDENEYSSKLELERQHVDQKIARKHFYNDNLIREGYYEPGENDDEGSATIWQPTLDVRQPLPPLVPSPPGPGSEDLGLEYPYAAQEYTNDHSESLYTPVPSSDGELYPPTPLPSESLELTEPAFDPSIAAVYNEASLFNLNPPNTQPNGGQYYLHHGYPLPEYSIQELCGHSWS